MVYNKTVLSIRDSLGQNISPFIASFRIPCKIRGWVIVELTAFPPASLGNGSANLRCPSDPCRASLPRRTMKCAMGRRPGTCSTVDFCVYSQRSQQSSAHGRTDLNLSYNGENLYPAKAMRHASSLSDECKNAVWKLLLEQST